MSLYGNAIFASGRQIDTGDVQQKKKNQADGEFGVIDDATPCDDDETLRIIENFAMTGKLRLVKPLDKRMERWLENVEANWV